MYIHKDQNIHLLPEVELEPDAEQYEWKVRNLLDRGITNWNNSPTFGARFPTFNAALSACDLDGRNLYFHCPYDYGDCFHAFEHLALDTAYIPVPTALLHATALVEFARESPGHMLRELYRSALFLDMRDPSDLRPDDWRLLLKFLRAFLRASGSYLMMYGYWPLSTLVNEADRKVIQGGTKLRDEFGVIQVDVSQFVTRRGEAQPPSAVLDRKNRTKIVKYLEKLGASDA